MERTHYSKVEEACLSNDQKLILYHYRQDTRELFTYLQQTIDEYNHEPYQSRWESIKLQKLQADDAIRLAQQAKEDRYPSITGPKSRGPRVKEKLNAFCSHIADDVFVLGATSQLYAAWESAVWGSLKFLLTARINYRKLKEQVAVHLGDIGEHLGIISALLRLYPLDEMCEHVSGVYTELAKFLAKAIRFYGASRFSRLIDQDISWNLVADHLNRESCTGCFGRFRI